MNYPNFKEEKKLWRKGYKWVAGLDEAGRGPLAGPVIAAAVAINPNFKALNPKQYQSSKFKNSKHEFRNLDFSHLDLFRVSDLGFRISKFRDSKKLTSRARDKFYEILTNHPKIWWGIGIVSEKVIDKINILNATKLAMTKAISNLIIKSKCQKFHCSTQPNVKTNQKFKKTKKTASQILDDRLKSAMLKLVDFLILDGNMKLNIDIPQKAIIRADEKVFSCAAASILAKVTRDRMMLKYDKKYPEYGFKKHKGYPTRLHFLKLQKFGPCKIHRKSFL